MSVNIMEATRDARRVLTAIADGAPFYADSYYKNSKGQLILSVMVDNDKFETHQDEGHDPYHMIEVVLGEV